MNVYTSKGNVILNCGHKCGSSLALLARNNLALEICMLHSVNDQKSYSKVRVMVITIIKKSRNQ